MSGTVVLAHWRAVGKEHSTHYCIDSADGVNGPASVHDVCIIRRTRLAAIISLDASLATPLLVYTKN